MKTRNLALAAFLATSALALGIPLRTEARAMADDIDIREGASTLLEKKGGPKDRMPHHGDRGRQR